MTQFGYRPDSHSIVARKIEAFVKARAAQQLIPVVHVPPPPVVIPKKDWRPLREFLCERYATDRVLSLRVRVYLLRHRLSHPHQVTGAEILREIAEHRGVPIPTLIGASRVMRLVIVRHEVAYEMASRTDLSLSQIGKVLGRRDHTTIYNSIHKHATRNNLPLPRGMLPCDRLTHRKRITYSGWEAVPA